MDTILLVIAQVELSFYFRFVMINKKYDMLTHVLVVQIMMHTYGPYAVLIIFLNQNMTVGSRVFQPVTSINIRRLVLTADSAYPRKHWLVTPTQDPDFNTKHVQGRGILERTIGVLKNRYRCLLGARQLHYDPEKCGVIINVCCALHNMCIANNLQLDEDDY